MGNSLERGLLINFNSVPLKSGIRRLSKSNPSSVLAVSPPIHPCRESNNRRTRNQTDLLLRYSRPDAWEKGALDIRSYRAQRE